MDMLITFTGGKKVEAQYKGFTIKTDQPEKAGGDNSAPTPFDLFLSSIGTCVGIYVLNFCQERGISAEGAGLLLKFERNPETGMVGNIGIDINLPQSFPEKYSEAVKRAADLCPVKRHLMQPPEFGIRVKINR